MGQTDLDAGLGAICIAIYIMLVICAGFLYSSDSGMPFLYPVLLTCLGATLTGLALLSYACKPGQGAWSIPGMIILIAGALPTAPSSLLVKPMIKVLGRQKLQLLLRQETVNSNNNSEETRLIN